jgi:TPR repeat protein
MLLKGEGVLMNRSLALHYFQSSADQGNAPAQFAYGLILSPGEGILMNKSLAIQ